MFYEKGGRKLMEKKNFKIWLLTHERERNRPTNTGRLIKETFPEETEIFYWSRVEPPPILLNLLKNQTFYPILVFPAFDQGRVRIDEKAFEVATEKIPAFIILDGVWKESRKMLRKSDYLDGLPFIAFENLEKTRYTLRRNKDVDHICTVEVAVELLRMLNLQVAAENLNNVFDNFLQEYE
jgi:DTW domain-containing protein YfiP